ncbi:MAG: translocation/assembly module TamB [Treponema sp.]|nr:translocation/assembly module TamB [Treponema sp.]
MGIFTKKQADRGKGAFIPVLKRLFVFAVFVACTVPVLVPLGRLVTGRMRELRDTWIHRAEAYLGRTITYSSMSPSLFGAVDIRNIRITGADGLPVLSVRRFTLSYSFFDFIRGKEGALKAVLIESPEISFDSGRDADLLALFSRSGDMPGSAAEGRGAAGRGGEGLALFSEGLAFRVRDGRFTAVSGGNSVRVSDLRFDLSVHNGRVNLDGKWRTALSLSPVSAGPFSVETRTAVSGSLARDLGEGDLSLTFPYVRGDLFGAGALGADIHLGGGALSVRKKADALPYDFSLEYGIETKTLSAGLEYDGFVPSALFSFSGGLEKYGPFLSTAVSGYAELRREGEELRYAVDMTGGGDPGEGGNSFALAAKGNGDQVDFERCRFSLPEGTFSYQGSVGFRPLAPNGTLSVSDFTLSGNGGLSTELSVVTQGSEISLFGEVLESGGVELSGLDAMITLEERGASFAISALRFTGTESYGDVRMGALSLEGSLDNGESPRVDANVRIDSFSAGDLAAMTFPFLPSGFDIPLPVRLIGNDTLVTTEIFFTTDFTHVLYNIPRLAVAYNGARETVALLSVSGTDQRFDLSEGRIVWPEGSVEISGYAEFADPMDISFSLMTSFLDQAYFVNGIILDGRSVSVQGSYGLGAYISASGSGYSGYIEADYIPVPFRGHAAALRLFSSVRYDSAESWSLDLERFELSGLSTPASSGAVLRIAGQADQDGAFVPVLYFDDGLGSLSGRAVFSWERNFSLVSGSAFLSEAEEDGSPSAGPERGKSSEHYALELSFEEGSLDLELRGEHARLGRLSGARNAIADGSLRVNWNTSGDLRGDLAVDSLSAGIGDNELVASASASLDNRIFSVRDLRVQYADLEGTVPLFTVDRESGEMRGGLSVNGSAGGRDVLLELSLESAFRPVASWLFVRRISESFDGVLHVGDARFGALGSGEPFDFVFSRAGSDFRLQGGPDDMIRFRLGGEGSFYAGLSAPSPVRGTVSGTIVSNTIDARCPDLYVDLSALWNILPRISEVALTSGYAAGSVEIRGPLGDPEFFGTVKGTSVGIQITHYLSRDIRPVPFTARLEGNGISWGPVPARVGGGAGIAGGWFIFDRWIPDTFLINISVPPETPIPYGFDIGGFLASGDASGELHLGMENMIFNITGDLVAQNTELGLNMDRINAARAGELFGRSRIPTLVNMTVTTGKQVEFTWPTTGFPIIQAYADIGTQVKITADTSVPRFSIVSDINVSNGELYYFERSFYIRSGTIILRENEERFEPRISARAEVRDRTDSGPVTISLVVNNAPLFNFTARFESSPPLSQSEIFSLLGQPITGTGGENPTGAMGRALLGSTADVLAQFQVVRRLERGVRDFLRLDMFSVRTQLLQNAIFENTLYRINRDPVDRNAVVGNYFDNTSVFLGKYITPDFFGQAMLSLRYDANRTSAGGFSGRGLALGGGIVLEGDLGLEIKGPLFDIRWGFMPLHPETLFVSDMSITLLWRRSF